MIGKLPLAIRFFVSRIGDRVVGKITRSQAEEQIKQNKDVSTVQIF